MAGDSHSLSLPARPSAIEESLQPFFILRKRPVLTTSRKKKDLTAHTRLNKKPFIHAPEEENEQLYRLQQLETLSFIWSNIEKSVKAVLRRINADLFNEVHAWVRESFHTIKLRGTVDSGALWTCPVVMDISLKQIHTALLLTQNVEPIDDILTFDELAVHLKSYGYHVAKFSSLDLTTKDGIGGCLKNLLRQLVGVTVDGADITALAAWYTETGKHEWPVVVIINDTERCNGPVLAEFINMLSEWVCKVPFILIMGITTTLEAPVKLLPMMVLQHLRISTFSTKSPTDKMDALIEGVFLKNWAGFGIGFNVAAFIKTYFLIHDGTVTSFIKAMKIACTKHFSMEPLGFLIKGIKEDNQNFWKENCRLLPEELIKYAFSLPSCEREKFSERTGNRLSIMLSKLKESQMYWRAVVLCLFETGKHQKMRLQDIYYEALNPEFCNSSRAGSNLEREMASLSSSSANGICYDCSYFDFAKGRCITQAINVVRTLSLDSLRKLVQIWGRYTHEITKVNLQVKELLSLAEVENGGRSSMPCKTHANGSHESCPFSFNERAAVLLECMVRDYLIPLECQPFHEIFCFVHTEVLQCALTGDPRQMLQFDLLKPHVYLCHSCYCKEGAGLLPLSHDTSVMYKLAQEHGDLINLHDWYQTFREKIINSNHKNMKTRRNSKRHVTMISPNVSEAQIQARFCRAVIELQITGLLRMPSKKRPDVVQRVAFGL